MTLSACANSINDRFSTGPYESSKTIKEYVFRGKSAASFFPRGPQRDLVNAACAGNQKKLRKAIAEGANPNQQATPTDTGNLGLPPLLLMLECRSPKGIELLIDAGADPNGTDFSERWNPVGVFAHQPDPSYLTTLLENGADPNLQNVQQSRAPAIYGVRTAHIETGKWTNLEILMSFGYDLGGLCNEQFKLPCELQRMRINRLIFADSVCKAEKLLSARSYHGEIEVYLNIKARFERGSMGVPPIGYEGEVKDCYMRLFQMLEKRYGKDELDRLGDIIHSH